MSRLLSDSSSGCCSSPPSRSRNRHRSDGIDRFTTFDHRGGNGRMPAFMAVEIAQDSPDASTGASRSRAAGPSPRGDYRPKCCFSAEKRLNTPAVCWMMPPARSGRNGQYFAREREWRCRRHRRQCQRRYSPRRPSGFRGSCRCNSGHSRAASSFPGSPAVLQREIAGCSRSGRPLRPARCGFRRRTASS